MKWQSAPCEIGFSQHTVHGEIFPFGLCNYNPQLRCHMGRRAKQRQDAIRCTGGRSPAARTRRARATAAPAEKTTGVANADIVLRGHSQSRGIATWCGMRRRLTGSPHPRARMAGGQIFMAPGSKRGAASACRLGSVGAPMAWSVRPPRWSAITCAAAGRTGSVSLPTGAHWRQEVSSPAYALKRRSAPRSDTTLAPRASGQVAFALAMVRRPVFP